MKRLSQKIMLFALLWVPLAFGLFCIGSNWRVASPRMAHLLSQFCTSSTMCETLTEHLTTIPRIARKNQLNALDALSNTLSLFVTVSCLISICIVLACFLMLTVGIPLALLSGRFSTLVFTALCIFSMPVLIVALSLGTWLVMLFEPCTAGYFIIWLLTGIPAILAGMKLNMAVYRKTATLVSVDAALSVISLHSN